jgi:RNase P protein component
MLFMLATKRNLLARSSRELFSKFPDLAVALGIVIALLPQVVTKYALASLFN